MAKQPNIEVTQSEFLSTRHLSETWLKELRVNATYSKVDEAFALRKYLKENSTNLHMINVVRGAVSLDQTKLNTQKYIADYFSANNHSAASDQLVLLALGKRLGMTNLDVARKQARLGAVVMDELSRAFSHPESDGTNSYGLDRHPEFKELVEKIVGDVVTKINNKAHLIESEVKYSRQYVLETVIARLQDLV